MRQELKECDLRAQGLQGRVMQLQDRVHLIQGRQTADSRPSSAQEENVNQKDD